MPTLVNDNNALGEKGYADTAVYPVYHTLVAALAAQRYKFICPTPETHARVIAKRTRLEGPLVARTLQDLLGWSIPAST